MGVLVVLLGLVVFGAHVVVPGRLAAGAPRQRRPWSLGALPLLGAASLVWLLWLGRHPDTLLAAGWETAPVTVVTARAVMVLVPALAILDGLLLFGRERLEPAGWRLASLFAVAPLIATAAGAEILRVGQGPATEPLPLAAAVLCRAAVALGAGEVIAPWPRWRRPLWGVPAGVLLAFYPLSLPAEVRQALAAGGDLLTLGAAVLLLFVPAVLPERLRRPVLAAGVLLAALFLGRAAEVAEGFVRYLEPVRGLPAL